MQVKFLLSMLAKLATHGPASSAAGNVVITILTFIPTVVWQGFSVFIGSIQSFVFRYVNNGLYVSQSEQRPLIYFIKIN
ncbi:hypothetical protein GCM10020331_023360 [Ectobacillus funiculus]